MAFIGPSIKTADANDPLPSDLAIASFRDLTTVYAGEIVFLSVVGTGLTRDQLKLWSWDWTFDDTGTWSALDANFPFGNARGSAIDTPQVIYGWPVAGVKTVTCRARRLGFTTRVLTLDVTVLDPDNISAANTIILDPDGSYDGPSTWNASTKVTTLSDAFDELADNGTGQILVRPNATISDSKVARFEDLDTDGIALIDSWDRSSDFVIDCDTAAFQAWNGRSTNRLGMRRTIFAGSYDPYDGSGAAVNNGLRAFDFEGVLSLFECRSGGIRSSLTVERSSEGLGRTAWRVQGCKFSDDLSGLGYGKGHQNYGVFLTDGDGCGLADSSIRQDLSARNGSEGKQLGIDGNQSDHAAIRYANMLGSFAVYRNDLRTLNGWSNSSATVFGEIMTALQPVMRIGSQQCGTDARGTIAHNVCEGPISIYASSASGVNGRADWVFSRGNIVIGTDMQWKSYGIDMGHTNVISINDVLIQPNVDNLFNDGTMRAFRLGEAADGGGDANWAGGTYEILNATIIDWRNAANTPANDSVADLIDESEAAVAGIADATITGTQYYIPNRTPSGESAPVITGGSSLINTETLRDATYPGYQFVSLDDSQSFHNTAGATPSGSVVKVTFDADADLSSVALDFSVCPAADAFGNLRDQGTLGAFVPEASP